jgi:uncharacterized membrane protein
MTSLNTSDTRVDWGEDRRATAQSAQRDWPQGQSPSARQQQQPREMNVADSERAVSVAAGSIIALLGLSRGSLPGLLGIAVGGSLIYRGATGHCPMYQQLGLNTAREEQDQQRNWGDQPDAEEEISERGIHVEQAFLINKSPEELYRFWRNFENLPRIMTHLESVRVSDDRRSHWVAKTNRIIGKVEWDAEVTTDEPNSRIGWRSLSGSDIDTTGEIRFAKAMGDRGTEVHVFMDYVPPAGRMGHWLATLFGSSPRRMLREDLRNFKRIMEIGEILTIIGQPHGTCTGQGERYTE